MKSASLGEKGELLFGGFANVIGEVGGIFAGEAMVGELRLGVVAALVAPAL
jgi:hypothetical protein